MSHSASAQAQPGLSNGSAASYSSLRSRASMSHSASAQAQPGLSNGSAASYSSLRSRSGGLVDYDFDKDDEDYKPPLRKQSAFSNEDEGIVESLRLKRKLGPKEEPEPIKKQRIGKNSKSKNSVFAALCSPLSRAVLPNKRTASTLHIVPSSSDSKNGSIEENRPDNGSIMCSDECTSSDEANHEDKESADPRNGSDSMQNDSDNRKLSGEDFSLIPLNTSPEMAVNGS